MDYLCVCVCNGFYHTAAVSVAKLLCVRVIFLN